MTRLQIGLTGRYVGRGLWRRVFGSGPIRVTPIDAAINPDKEAEVRAAAETLQRYLESQSESDHRVGSMFNVEDVRLFIQTKTE